MVRHYLKLSLLLALLFAGTQTLLAQEETNSPPAFDLLTEKPHEVNLNLLTTTILLHPEVSYSYTLNRDISVGAKMGLGLDSSDGFNEVSGKFQLMPFARWHFYRNPSGNSLRGFYIEANLAYTYYDGVSYNPNVRYDNGKMGYELGDKREGGSALGIGLGFGYRWITSRGWTFELGSSMGRNIVHPEPAPSYGSFAFSVGKRF